MNRKTNYCVLGLLIAAVVCSCTNSPYRTGETAGNTYFGAFGTPPTKLDPASAYYVHEGRIIDQIYEPPFTYHYLKRPYELIPLTAEDVPAPAYFGQDGLQLADPDPPPDMVTRTEYTIRLKRGIMYQDHPCFARDSQGQSVYEHSTARDLAEYNFPSDFDTQATRELKAEDYSIQVRRLADPRTSSPVFSTMAQYILGMSELRAALQSMLDTERARRKDEAGGAYDAERDERDRPILLDYMAADFPGVEIINDHTFKIVLKRKYPQILYWMCMHFFAPMPREAIEFYALPVIAQKEFSVNKCPVGTGPYYLKIFKPNEKIVLEQNPNYHDDYYPSEGAAGDIESGLLADAGTQIPFIRRQVLLMEKEEIPSWNKFLQGYYDSSGISSDVFDQAIQMKTGEDMALSDVMRNRGIRLVTDIDTMFWYTGFNMRDEVVGGYEPEKCKLRQAISIALDYNEFLDIFANGRGVLAQGPIPPGIFGYRDGKQGTNPFVDEWDPDRARHVRKSINVARQLMKEAGYPDGRGPDGEPLTINYDHAAQGESFFRSIFDWYRRRLDLIGVRMEDCGTDLSRFRQKKDQGNWQVASSGWLADYPDPENFLFLFYGPNGLVEFGGANSINYRNAEYDELFNRMESMMNSDERQAIIDQMMRIIQHDAPAVWQYHPVSFGLQHEWFTNVKPHQMSYNTMKYKRLDPQLRTTRQREWNKPVWQPIAWLLAILLIGMIPAGIAICRRETRA